MSKHNKFYPVEYSTIKKSLSILRKLDDYSIQKKSEVIDVFDHCLREDECELLDFSYREHNLRYEYQYLDLFKDLFLFNQSNVILEFSYKNIRTIELINIIEGLDQKEKIDFLTLIKNQKFSLTSDFYRIEDFDLLSIIIKIMTRELFFDISLYFSNLGISILSGYDLSLPVCYASLESRAMIDSIARKHQLFLR